MFEVIGGRVEEALERLRPLAIGVEHMGIVITGGIPPKDPRFASNHVESVLL